MFYLILTRGRRCNIGTAGASACSCTEGTAKGASSCTEHTCTDRTVERIAVGGFVKCRS